MERDDVRVIQRGDGTGFLPEAPEPIGVSSHRCRQDLERHIAAHSRIRRAIHLAHPAGPEDPGDLVMRESAADQTHALVRCFPLCWRRMGRLYMANAQAASVPGRHSLACDPTP